MNSQKIRRLCVAMITLPVVAIGASTVGRAQTKSFDGAYKGTLECEQGLEVYRMPLAIIIRDGLVVGGALLLDPDGRRVAPETGSGTVNPDGVRSGLGNLHRAISGVSA